MSADPTEYLSLLLAQQQQPQRQQQQQQGSAPDLQQLLQQLGAAPATSAAQQQAPSSMGTLNNFLTNYLQGAASGTSNTGLCLPQAPTPTGIHAPQLNNHGTASISDNGSVQQQMEHLLQSAKLLSKVAPGLAVAAMEQALALVSSDTAHPAQSQNPLQQQQQLGAAPPSHEQLLRALMSSQSNAAPAPSSSTPSNNNGNETTCNSIQTNSFARRSSDNNANEIKINTDVQGRSPSASLPRMPAPSHQTNRATAKSASGLGGAAGMKARQNRIGLSQAPLPPEPVSLLTLQTWSLEKLESHVKKLVDCNLPVPNAVKIVLEDARHKQEKKHAKRIANRKSASFSRARKKTLIDALTAAHAKLRRQALILSYLPDPVVVIDTNSKIKFCSIQMERVVGYKLDELIGSSIEDIIVPGSRDAIRQLIEDLVNAEQRAIAAAQQGENVNNSNDSGESSNDANVVSRDSEQSFPLLEVNVDGEDEVGAGENVSDSSEDPTSKKDNKSSLKKCATAMSFTQKESSLTSETSPSEDNDEPSVKKAKCTTTKKIANSQESSATSKTHPGSVIDDVMGSSVTANNADAKLSSLLHYPKNEAKQANGSPKQSSDQAQQQHDLYRKHLLVARATSNLAEKQEDSRSSLSADSTPVARPGRNSSDSGDSNESSDDVFEEDECDHRPLAPGCNVCLIRNDLTTIWCEVTSSIRTRTFNDEDSELGILDPNPKSRDIEAPYEEEKELSLCFRPILEGPKFYGKKKSDNKDKDDNVHVDNTSTGTETDCAKKNRPIKKRSFAAGGATMVSGQSVEKKRRESQANSVGQKDEQSVAESP